MRLGGIEMENMFLWSLILIFSVLSFNFNFTLSGVNRAFLGLFKAIPMNNVMAFESYQELRATYGDEVMNSLLERIRHNYVSVTMKSDLGLYGEFTKSLHFSIEASGHE